MLHGNSRMEGLRISLLTKGRFQRIRMLDKDGRGRRLLSGANEIQAEDHYCEECTGKEIRDWCADA